LQITTIIAHITQHKVDYIAAGRGKIHSLISDKSNFIIFIEVFSGKEE